MRPRYRPLATATARRRALVSLFADRPTARRHPSQPHAFAPNALNEARIVKGLWAIEIVGPERQGLDHDTGFHQYIKSDACHVKRGGGAIAMLAVQHDGNIH